MLCPGGDLYSYDINNGMIIKVFSFRDAEGIDERENWNHHDIKIVSVDEAGSIDFVVYGYMNRGTHEGGWEPVCTIMTVWHIL